MNGIEYLSQLKWLDKDINSDLQELEKLKELRISISSPKFDSIGSAASRTGEPSFIEIVDKIADLENQINKEIDRYIDLKAEIRNKIKSIPDNQERYVLQEKYILFHTNREIAESLNCSIRQVREIHRKAVQTFNDKFNFSN